ncbi:MAG: extracellular solute-binding protein [Clostridia bacterium]|nr:extracellular solute-binding protein [Clostridia bacterium]MDR3644488.1 extracellular solute-binding protein [Clostridia bacterium]
MSRSRKKGLPFIKIVAILIACTAIASITAGCSGGGSAKKTLNILCFQGYADDTWVKPFEKQYNCTVNVTYAGTVEEMYTKAKAGGGQYDILSTDCGSVQRYYEAGLIQPLDMGQIPNTSKLSQFFQKNADYKTIDGKVYHSPIVWGSNNVVYNKDKLGTLPDSWSVLWDPKYKGEVSVTDEANNNVVTTAIYLGFKDPYNLTTDQLNQVKAKLIALKNNCRELTNGFDSEKNALSTGETLASVSGYDSGLILYLKNTAKMNVGRIMPKEGIYIWIDGWVLLKGAKSPDLAQDYMNYILSDEVQIDLAKSLSFGAVTPAAKSALDPYVCSLTDYDNIDNIKVPIFIMKNPENVDLRTQIWNDAKAAS